MINNIFQIDDKLHDCFYVVASGVIHLSVIADAEETLLNKCHEGDIFGLRPFFAKNNYMMTAKAREESIVYAIPIATFRPFVANNPNVLDFLLESFALFKDKPTTLLNIITGCFSTVIGLLMLYITVCFIYFTCFRSTSVGQTLLITLGF